MNVSEVAICDVLPVHLLSRASVWHPIIECDFFFFFLMNVMHFPPHKNPELKNAFGQEEKKTLSSF